MENLIITEEYILKKIYHIRGQKVMLDRDLADLYNVATKVLKQSVKRNMSRFPEDFMFEMTIEEFSDWRSQFVTSNSDNMGLRYAPFCFTEQGIAMLSSILNSEKAINVNIQIIRIFTRIRQILLDHSQLKLDIEIIKSRLNEQDQNMEIVFKYLDHMAADDVPQKRRRIGFKPDNLDL